MTNEIKKHLQGSVSSICQNCKNEFIIDSDDLAFYQKIDVPPPTFCFLCRVQRRMAFRNERILYKRKCDALGHDEQMISIFSPQNPQRVYDHKEWWGDTWDGATYGREIDFSIPFFEQLRNLWKEVPDVALLNINPVNSEYCSITEGNKNCYLVFGGDFNENTIYSTYIFRSKECADTYWVSSSEFNYETIDCTSCSRILYSRYCDDCYNSAFLFNCINCHDCFGCANLKNKSYCIFNVQYTKEEYLAKMKEFDLGSVQSIENMRERFNKHMLLCPRRFARMLHSVNSTGDNLEEAKNCKHCFDIFGGGEDCSYVWLAYSKIRDCVNVDRVGLNSELVYDSSSVYPGSRIFFSRFVFDAHDIFYSYNVHNSSNLFGCVGLRNKHYCILNKQYTQEEYEKLVPRLIEHMNTKPYIDKKGCVYKFGEFFPSEISPFAYNETIAQELFPLSREKAEQEGFVWNELEDKTHKATKQSSEIPDHIKDVDDTVLQEIIECEHKGSCADQCTRAFKIIPSEFAFYKHMNIPVPRLCPSCRHYRRLRQRNPIKLWSRKCNCAGIKSDNNMYQNISTTHSSHSSSEHCINEFETSYSPDRSEIVYCEQCYQSEVV